MKSCRTCGIPIASRSECNACRVYRSRNGSARPEGPRIALNARRLERELEDRAIRQMLN